MFSGVPPKVDLRALMSTRPKHRPWLTALLARRPTKVAAIALANKIARMARAMMARGERYKEPIALARRDVKVGKANSTQCRAGRSGDQDNPQVPPHGRMRAFDRDLIRGGHYGQRSWERRGRLSQSRPLPEFEGDGQGIDPQLGPPARLVSGSMEVAVVQSAERDREF